MLPWIKGTHFQIFPLQKVKYDFGHYDSKMFFLDQD